MSRLNRPWKLSCAAAAMVALGFWAGDRASADEALGQLLAACDKAMSEGHFEQAAAHANQVLQLDPDNAEAHNQLGLCYVHEHRFDQAASQFEASLRTDGSYLPGLHNLGSMYYRQGQYEKAIEFFQKEIAKQSQPSAMAITSLADAYRDLGHLKKGSAQARQLYDRALSLYAEGLKEAPDSPELHNHLGVCYFQLGELKQAELQVRKAAQLKPDYAAAHYNLALILEKQGRLKEATDAFQTSLRYENDPYYRKQVSQLLAQVGAATARKQQTEQAEVILQPSRDRQLAHDYLSKASGCFARRDYASAQSILKRAVNAEGKQDPVAWNNLGFALAMQGRHEEAIPCYKQAVALLPDGFPAAQYNLGQSLKEQGRLDEAEKCFKLAVQQAGGMNALAHNALGVCYKRRHQLAAARDEYKLAILQCGDTVPVFHFNLGLALQAEAEHNKDLARQAASQYQRYLQQAPSGINAPEAKSRLAQLHL